MPTTADYFHATERVLGSRSRNQHAPLPRSLITFRDMGIAATSFKLATSKTIACRRNVSPKCDSSSPVRSQTATPN